MVSIINNFVSVRKNRGDLMNPAEYRSILEMVNGILAQYDLATLNSTYKQLLDHLADYHDPHHVTQQNFSDQLITSIYKIYATMTGSPVTEDVFRTTILPTAGFIELLRRIMLNRILYDQVKNPDGTVNATVTAYIGPEWGNLYLPKTKVTLSFGTTLPNEAAFIARGWNTNTTPRPIIYNANDLAITMISSNVIFHTSRTSEYLLVGGTGTSYPVTLYGSSNDFTLRLRIIGNPLTKTDVFYFTSGANSFYISMFPDRSVEIRLNAQIIATGVPCNDGQLSFNMKGSGFLILMTSHNSVFTTNNYFIDLSTVGVFATGIVNVPLEDFFATTFGIRSLTIFKDTTQIVPATDIVPMIRYMPPSAVVPLTGTVSSGQSINTGMLSPDTGYYLYLTLTGSWTGTVVVQHSTDNGVTWNAVTTNGQPAGTYIRNCDEDVLKVSDPNSKYRLAISVTSGALAYRLAQ